MIETHHLKNNFKFCAVKKNQEKQNKMKVDIHNLKIAVARELSLHAFFFKNTTDQNIVKKWRLCLKQNTHKNFTEEKYRSVINEHSHKFSNALYSH